jgi:hypothetical protein
VGAQPSVQVPTPAPITPISVYHVVFQAENDVFNNNLNARQPIPTRIDCKECRNSTFDFYGLSISSTDTGDSRETVDPAAMIHEPADPNFTQLADQHRPPLRPRRAFRINRWVTKDVDRRSPPDRGVNRSSSPPTPTATCWAASARRGCPSPR